MLSREEIRQGMLASISNNKPIIGVAVGSGFSAKQAVAGGADVILVLNAGRFRMAGLSSMAGLMPYANSNKMVMEFGVKEILSRVKMVPVIFGVCATDPTVDQDDLLNKIKAAGFHGVNNFPTVGLIDGLFREALEEQQLGFQQEVQFMKKAVDNNLFTIAFVFDEDQAKAMATVHVDVICAHLGFTYGGVVGVKQRISLMDGAVIVNRIFSAASSIDPDILKMVYGGPIAEPKQAKYFYSNAGAVGYIGGSSFERIPTESSIVDITDQFKNFSKLKEENESLKKELRKKTVFDEIVGQSRNMQQLYEIVSKVADKDVNVLVYGESGTGKELVVRAIHYNSKRFNQAFIKVNCAAIPETLLESELFGHEKGSFTGATQRRLGLFELADRGTLFLDEIGEMSADTQVKLLRAIQEQEFQRVGGNKTIKVDVRIVCATNKDLRCAVTNGKFREDLYYRINVISIRTPPLRLHKEDIPLLVNYFLGKINDKFGRGIRKLTPVVLNALMHYDWPGNVRELEHALESAAILCDTDTIGVKDLPISFQSVTFQGHDAENSTIAQMTNQTMSLLEKKIILEALDQHAWNREKTAGQLGINRRTLLNKMTKYDIKQNDCL